MATPCSNAGHPGNNYYVNGITGAIQRASGVTRLIIGPVSAYSGPYTWCQAKAFAENRSFSGFAHGSAEQNIGNIAVQDIFHGINFQNWILRVGEMLLGIVLIGVGIAKLTGTDNFIMKTATKVGKAAIL